MGPLPAKLSSFTLGPPLGPSGHRLALLESAGPNTKPAGEEEQQLLAPELETVPPQ